MSTDTPVKRPLLQEDGVLELVTNRLAYNVRRVGETDLKECNCINGKLMVAAGHKAPRDRNMLHEDLPEEVAVRNKFNLSTSDMDLMRALNDRMHPTALKKMLVGLGLITEKVEVRIRRANQHGVIVQEVSSLNGE